MAILAEAIRAYRQSPTFERGAAICSATRLLTVSLHNEALLAPWGFNRETAEMAVSEITKAVRTLAKIDVQHLTPEKEHLLRVEYPNGMKRRRRLLQFLIAEDLEGFEAEVDRLLIASNSSIRSHG